MNRPIYLDYNGTTPHAPEVIEAMLPYLKTEFGNPSSSHWYGLGPKNAVAKARQQVAGLLGCQSEEVLFTSGGTESNNQAVKCIGGSRASSGKHMITSNIEHPAIYNVCAYMQKRGFEVTFISADKQGVVNAADVVAAIRPDTIMISIMHANNEVGTIQPIEEIGGLLQDKSILFHSDAAQSLGKIETQVDSLGVELLSIAGHKLYAPKGIGALYIKTGADPEIFCHGASQEQGRRGGTENVLEIVGLGEACAVATRYLDENQKHMQTMRDRLEEGLASGLADICFNGHREKRLPNTASVSFYGVDANTLLEAIGDDVAASAGAACHSGEVQISHVLRAMHIEEQWARGTVRFTTGRMTTAEEIDRAVEVICRAVKKLRN